MTVSVVIPAHNEQDVLARCLSRLLDKAQPGELEIVVVCNGCTDNTEQVATEFGHGVRVMSSPIASKTVALNLGDAAARAFPRFYLDADVEVDMDAIRAMAELLRSGSAMIASPRFRPELSASPWAVRQWTSIWMRLPYVTDGVVGTGVYALSEGGRQRFDEFPDLICEDFFVRNQFTAGERAALTEHIIVVHAPRRLRDLIRRRTRVHLGNIELAQRYPQLTGTTMPSRRHGVLAVEPWNLTLVPAKIIFIVINIMIRLRAQWKLHRGLGAVWERDESSRVTGR